jgi:hypothetical protein
MYVLIENPRHADKRLMKAKAAARYVARGQAKWTGEARIRFVDSDHRERLNEKLLEMQMNRGYDNRGILTIKEIRELPVCMPVKLTTNPTSSKHRPDSRHRNGPVKIIYARAA